MEKEIIRPYFLNQYANRIELDVPKDAHTSDKDLRNKLRCLNLVKYNPNLFTNKDTGFLHIMGGEKAVITTLSMGLLFALYRSRVNLLRQSSIREGIWMINLYFVYGCALGAFYSACFFWRWQIHFNDINAHWLMKRYKGANELNRTNIYRFKDVPNGDECYNFSNKYFNHAHI